MFFKINRGLEANLPATLTNGYCYFCTDTTNFYIDFLDTNGILTRSKLSSKYADELRYTDGESYVYVNPADIATKTELNELASTVAYINDTDNGTVEGVETADNSLPTVTTADNGKFLRVVNGAWAAVEIENAEEATY